MDYVEIIQLSEKLTLIACLARHNGRYRWSFLPSAAQVIYSQSLVFVLSQHESLHNSHNASPSAVVRHIVCLRFHHSRHNHHHYHIRSSCISNHRTLALYTPFNTLPSHCIWIYYNRTIRCYFRSFRLQLDMRLWWDTQGFYQFGEWKLPRYVRAPDEIGTLLSRFCCQLLSARRSLLIHC